MNKEILERAIAKATENGWQFKLHWVPERKAIALEPLHQGIDAQGELYSYIWKDGNNPLPPAFIFQHAFAKALWGDGLIGNKIPFHPSLGRDTPATSRAWQYHLQQMVIAEDPIKYLGEILG